MNIGFDQTTTDALESLIAYHARHGAGNRQTNIEVLTQFVMVKISAELKTPGAWPGGVVEKLEFVPLCG